MSSKSPLGWLQKRRIRRKGTGERHLMVILESAPIGGYYEKPVRVCVCVCVCVVVVVVV